jgi:hypothetical protein
MTPLGDAGVSACKLVMGPARQLWHGPPALDVSPDGVRVAFNTEAGAMVAAVARVNVPPSPFVGVGRRGASPPCAFAGKHVFCMDAAGGVHQRDVATGGDAMVAQARAGTRIGASVVGGHELLAFVREGKTTEGETLEAWLWSDDGKTQRLSDDGSGATFAMLAPRGEGGLAVMLDARSAMTPVHARTVTWNDRAILGPDAVVFLGGGAERHTRAALAVTSSGAATVLLPIARDLAFGLAVARVDVVPRTDSAVSWTDYDNGLDPAPVAATVGAARSLVARVIPLGKRPHAPRAIELGRVTDGGAFVSLGIVPTHGDPVDVAVAADGSALVLAYMDQGGTWIERRICP